MYKKKNNHQYKMLKIDLKKKSKKLPEYTQKEKEMKK